MLVLLCLKVEFHVLQIFQVFVLDLFSEGLLLSSDLFRLPSVFLLDSFDHIVELLEMVVVSLLHFGPFSQKLGLKDVDIPSELFHESLNPGLLDGEQSVDVNEMVADGNLILVVGLIEVFIKHLYESLLGVELSLIVLRVDVDLVTELFCFSNTHYFPPIGQQFFLVKTHYLVLTLNL